MLNVELAFIFLLCCFCLPAHYLGHFIMFKEQIRDNKINWMNQTQMFILLFLNTFSYFLNVLEVTLASRLL